MITRLLTFVLLLGVSWCVMTFTHECGHLFGGWVSGATLVSYDVRPWSLPYSLHSPDPNPLVTLWAGPMLGVLFPIAVAWTAKHPWGWFVADFCMIANGVYLAVAWTSGDRLLDTRRLLDAGAHPATVVLYCGVTITVV